MATKETEKNEAMPQSFDIAALKAELLEQLKAEMATEREAKQAELSAHDKRVNDWLEEYVTVQLFRDGKDYNAPVFVSVNGEACAIKRGYPVKVKRKFALLLDQSQRQNIQAAEFNWREEQANINGTNCYNL